MASSRAPFVVLARSFVAQFFESESVTSDMRMRQSIVFVFAFIVTPCLFLMVSVFPHYEMLVIPVRRGLASASVVRYATVRGLMAQDVLEWIAAVLVGYAMVAAGLVAVFVWDALTFDRRDAIVLGPLPLRGSTVVLAKLSALALFLLGSALALNVLNATLFALEMSIRPLLFVTNFVSVLVVTTAAAAFVLAVIVTIRCSLALAGGARLAGAVGSLLQFAFVAALLVFLVSVVAPPERPGLLPIPDTLSPPITWFVAWFEVLRRSDRASWDEVVGLSRRAMTIVPLAVIAAIATSIAAHWRQMQLALTGASSSGLLSRAAVSRGIARLLLGRDRIGRAAADFILTTVARNPAQRAPIAINTAIGFGMIVIGLSRAREDAELVLLAMPLMAAFWMTIGVRASFFVPSELPAAWTYFFNAPRRLVSYRAAMRASIVGLVSLPATAIAAAVGGWRHAVLTLLLVVAFAGFLALTINFVPFTRPYRPGHARLRKRWPIYLIGAYAFSYGFVGIERLAWDDPVHLAMLMMVLVAVTLAFDVAGRHKAGAWTIGSQSDTLDDDDGGAVVLRLDSAENRTMRSPDAGEARATATLGNISPARVSKRS
ncbi:MAG TPA: hypothetical protein VGY57_13170 [Vicinamibacterales bacterium]|nr:hypothetical protein [Vicinamibacterales bacterium]